MSTFCRSQLDKGLTGSYCQIMEGGFTSRTGLRWMGWDFVTSPEHHTTSGLCIVYFGNFPLNVFEQCLALDSWLRFHTWFWIADSVFILGQASPWLVIQKSDFKKEKSKTDSKISHLILINKMKIAQYLNLCPLHILLSGGLARRLSGTQIPIRSWPLDLMKLIQENLGCTWE